MEIKNLQIRYEIDIDINGDGIKDTPIIFLHSNFGKEYILRYSPVSHHIHAPFKSLDEYKDSIKEYIFDNLPTLYNFITNEIFIRGGVLKFIDTVRDINHPYVIVVLREEKLPSGLIHVNRSDLSKVIKMIDTFFSTEAYHVVSLDNDKKSCCFN